LRTLGVAAESPNALAGFRVSGALASAAYRSNRVFVATPQLQGLNNSSKMHVLLLVESDRRDMTVFLLACLAGRGWLKPPSTDNLVEEVGSLSVVDLAPF
jgi:hypothetical protein